MVHFLGSTKPWNYKYNPQTGSVLQDSGGPVQQPEVPFLNLWWATYHHSVLPLYGRARAQDPRAPPTRTVRVTLRGEPGAGSREPETEPGRGSLRPLAPRSQAERGWPSNHGVTHGALTSCGCRRDRDRRLKRRKAGVEQRGKTLLYSLYTLPFSFLCFVQKEAGETGDFDFILLYFFCLK